MARTGVLPGEMRFDCAAPVFYAFWDVGGMAERLNLSLECKISLIKTVVKHLKTLDKP